MVARGQLMASLPPRVILSMVEGETTVPATMLMESPEFIKLVQTADKLEELTEWVENNY